MLGQVWFAVVGAYPVFVYRCICICVVSSYPVGPGDVAGASITATGEALGGRPVQSEEQKVGLKVMWSRIYGQD